LYESPFGSREVLFVRDHRLTGQLCSLRRQKP
jgi:hypothetical protein